MKSELEFKLELKEECGVTENSLHNAKKLVDKYGSPISIKLHYDKDKWYLVDIRFKNDTIYQFTGFSWNYNGEGPTGLFELFKLCKMPKNKSDIVSWPQNINKTFYFIERKRI